MCIRILVFALVFAADQLIKHFIRMMPDGYVFFRIDPLFEIVSCTNTGAAFSLLSGHPLLLAVLSLIIALLLSVYIKRTMHLNAGAKTALACLLGGGLGNLWDRLFLGGVTDYIRLLFFRFPVFNLADIAVTLSVGTLVYMTLTNQIEIHTGDTNGDQSNVP